MAVKEVSVKFKASDGKEFGAKEDAERHDAVVVAAREFGEAKHRLGRVLAEREKTADGKPFEFPMLRDLYYVTPGWSGMPTLNRVSFYVWSCEFEIDEHLELVTIRQRKQVGRMSDGERVESYRIADLYATEKAANVALLAAQEKWLEARAAEVQETRDTVSPAPHTS
jgi:hypothetical protein